MELYYDLYEDDGNRHRRLSSQTIWQELTIRLLFGGMTQSA